MKTVSALGGWGEGGGDTSVLNSVIYQEKEAILRRVSVPDTAGS